MMPGEKRQPLSKQPRVTDLVELGIPLSLLGECRYRGSHQHAGNLCATPLDAGGTTMVDVDQLPGGGPALGGSS